MTEVSGSEQRGDGQEQQQPNEITGRGLRGGGGGPALERVRAIPSPRQDEREGERGGREGGREKDRVPAAPGAALLSQPQRHTRSRPGGEQGQHGPEQRGNDAEQLSWESDRELKMELRKTATGAAASDGRIAGGPIPAGAPVPSTKLSRRGSGGDKRAGRCGRRSRGKGNL